MKRYSEDHLWVDYRNGMATLGLSAYAAEEAGPLVFVDLPEVGTVLAPGDGLCVVESAKAALDIICPVGGTVIEVNADVAETPELINAAPESAGWLCRLTEVDPADLESLLADAEYDQYLNADEENA